MNLKIFKNYLYNIVMIFTNIIFPILLFPYASRVLTPENFGKFSFANSITSYFVVFATLGISSYGVREISNLKLKDPLELKKGITELILLTFISSAIAFIIYILLVYNLKEIMLEKKIFLIFSLQILFGFLSIDYFFIAMENHKRRTIRVLLIKSLSLLFLFKFVKKPEDYNIFAMVIIIPEILAKVVDFFEIRKYILVSKKLNIKKHLKPMFIIFIYLFSTTIYLNLDSTMLGFLKGNKEVGYYAVAIKMTKIIIPIITSFGVVLTPTIIKYIDENNKEKLFESIDYYFDFIIGFSLPIIIILYILSEQIIIFFSGKEYLSSLVPMRIMLPIILFISLSGLCAAQILIPLGQESKILKISIIGLIMNIGLNYLLIPKFGIIGAAVATLISEFLVCVMRLISAKKKLKTYIFLKKYRLNYIYSGLIIYFIGIQLNGLLSIYNKFIEIILLSSILFIVYILLLSLLFKDYYINSLINKIKER